MNSQFTDTLKELNVNQILLDKKTLDAREAICGDEHNISAIAIHSWHGTLVLDNAYSGSEFL